MNKEEYILELVIKGHSDEEIELLVKDKFPEEEIIPFMPAAPVASTNVTPQAYLDRLVAATIKLEAKKLSSAKIKYHKGELIFFQFQNSTEIPAIFNDHTLFQSYAIADNQAILGGNRGTSTNGSVISHTHTTNMYSQIHMVYGRGASQTNDRVIDLGTNSNQGINVGWSGDAHIDMTPQGGKFQANATGGNYNIAYGLGIVSYVFKALKNITYAEMGE